MDQVEEAGLEEVCVLNIQSCSGMLTFISVQRLKSALWLSIGKIVDEETIKLGVNATPQFIGALTEMVWAQIGTYRIHPDAWFGILYSLCRKHAPHQLTYGGRVTNTSTETVSQDLESFAK